MSRRKLIATLAIGAATLGSVAACSGSSGGHSASTITVAYEKFGTDHSEDNLMKRAKAQYEKAHKGITVKLMPIVADENDYYTKLNLASKSASTAPDVLYEDTFLVNSDISAGFLSPIDSYLAKWPDWSKFSKTSQGAGKGNDGKTYGVPMGTDTRGLYYNKTIFAKAGLPTNWQPKTWNDILTAARTIKSKVPGVIPFSMYSSKEAGEASTMQGFEMLLYGTDNQLWDPQNKKWVVSSKGFTDAANFVNTIFHDKLGPDPQDEVDPQFGQNLINKLMPASKVGIDLDGSWETGTWKKGGGAPWPQYSTVLGTAAMPTENGQGVGKTSMSGGWLLSVGSHSKNKQAAFDFITTALNRANTLYYDNIASQIAERSDVASDPAYTKNDPFTPFFTNLVKVTHFRPAYAQYPQVSDAIQTMMEAIMTGQSSVGSATGQFASTVKSAVGANNTTTG